MASFKEGWRMPDLLWHSGSCAPASAGTGAPPAEVRVLVLTGLGLNCEIETAEAFRLVGATPELVHLLDLLRRHAPSAR